jgi:two-component system LytT family response regulator
MNPLTVIIADDEPAAVSVIESLLRQFEGNVEIRGVATNGLETLGLVARHRPDLLFLDIDMPVVNGMQVMEQLTGMETAVIFTTGAADYALQALRLKAADYLLKPIDPEDFMKAVARAVETLRDNQPKPAESEPSRYVPSRLQIPTQNEIIFLQENEISHVKGMGSYCQIVTVSSEKITVSKSIGQMEQKLSPLLFFRSHNSCIINLDFVSKFVHRGGYFVEMKSGDLVEVSRRSKDGLLEVLSARSK